MRDGRCSSSSSVDGTRRRIAMRQMCCRLATCIGDNQNVTDPFRVLQAQTAQSPTTLQFILNWWQRMTKFSRLQNKTIICLDALCGKLAVKVKFIQNFPTKGSDCSQENLSFNENALYFTRQRAQLHLVSSRSTGRRSQARSAQAQWCC